MVKTNPHSTDMPLGLRAGFLPNLQSEQSLVILTFHLLVS